MTRLLQQGEMVLCLFGSLGCIALSTVFAVTEPTKNRSALALMITGGFALLAVLQAMCVVGHARHLGRLWWLWSALAISLVLWIAPVETSFTLYNTSAAIVIYAYAGVLGLASGAIGVLRELLPRALAQS